MTRAARALQFARNAARSAYLQNQVDIAHVYAQLHGRCAAEYLQFALPQLALRLKPLLLGDAAVMGAGVLVPGDGVYAVGQLFRLLPAVHKSQHGAGVF